MKKQPPRKNTPAKRAKLKSNKNQLGLVSFRIAEHRHTGKLIHHRHTSHIVLFGILVFLGFFLYVDRGMVSATEVASGSVSVSVVVPGAAPVKGAVISLPLNGSTVKDNIIDVKGTCLGKSFVVIQSNTITVGSAVCSDLGTFELKVQLSPGKNSLTALNYDNLNQSGPVTSAVTVTLQSDGNKSDPQPTAPVVPINPSVIPGVNAAISDCSDYKIGNLPTGGEPRVSVVCVPRLFEPKLEQTLGVLIWGGTPPYAVSVDWGDGSSSTLISLKSQSYRKETFSYKSAGNYKITFNLKDSSGKTAIAQTAVQVNGQTAAATTAATDTPLAALSNELFNTSWLKTPVPLYILAVAITLGFWGGDLFDRYFGDKKPHHRRRKIA